MTNLFMNLANKNLSTKMWPYELIFKKTFKNVVYHLTLHQDSTIFIIWKRLKNIYKPERPKVILRLTKVKNCKQKNC